MTQQTLNIVVGASQYDCAQHAANRNTALPLIYVYNEETLARYPKLPADAKVLFTRAVISDGSDLIDGVRKAMGVLAYAPKLFGFCGVWYPVTSITFINIDEPITVALYFGMTVQIRAKSILLDRRGIHVLEGEIVDAS